jgi:excisionase family DNA binding protein
MAEDLPQVLTIEEASKYLRIPLSSLYKLAQDAKIPCQKVGRHWRFRKVTLDQWLDDRSPSSPKNSLDRSDDTTTKGQ